MAETTSALCFSTLSTSVPFSKEQPPFSSPSTSFFTCRRFSSQSQRPRSPSLRFTVKASGSAHFPGDDDFGLYPWENPDAAESSVQWVTEERVTLFTSDGLIQIGGNLVPRRVTSADGLDTGRRLCIFGFCRSIEMLCDVVEDTVLEHGGEVVVAEKATKEGLHEKLTMTVAVPFLWGVPPASETLHLAVRSGGGIVDKVYWQWDFL
ncbi:hypothetical protein PHJA_002072400 [Phtheirospermum japonicum]|uniref:DUF7811 domain-containing protein n=1 Tax=Phtheirospermum japonicum TaxID=374723 RepID=A0A830CTW1_9LAMI|nr:hypothetical protein PHJA_002072400 [Phtheirospermum japonicum]